MIRKARCEAKGEEEKTRQPAAKMGKRSLRPGGDGDYRGSGLCWPAGGHGHGVDWSGSFLVRKNVMRGSPRGGGLGLRTGLSYLTRKHLPSPGWRPVALGRDGLENIWVGEKAGRLPTGAA